MSPAARFDGLHVLADDDPRWPDPVAQAESACRGGASVVQLRAKHAGDRRALEWARAIRALTTASGARFVVNDRFDLALLADADGVHLGQEDLPPDALPMPLCAGLGVGRSTHDLEQARACRAAPVAYVAFGPIFGTASKDSPYDARGLTALAAVVRAVSPTPVVAIGGIDAARLPSVLEAGARGVAVISAVAGAADPATAARHLASCFADGAA